MEPRLWISAQRALWIRNYMFRNPDPLRCHILGDTGPDPTLKQGHVKNDKERTVPNRGVTIQNKSFYDSWKNLI